MKKLILSAVVFGLSFSALAADKTAKADAPAEAKMGYSPRKVTKEDKKGIEAMLNANDAAWMKGDIDAVASVVDFPVYMVTDDSKGTVTTVNWDKAQWTATMSAAMKNMPHDPKMKMKHDRKFDFLTDSIAVVHDTVMMPMGKEKLAVKSTSLIILKDGKWMVKSMMEGGWGDSMATPTGDAKGNR